ncbi:MAG TPA: DUF4175 family protein [Rhizomicrobium sp.]|jgi:uncharacterized protein (TIGR02302 family)|nr:DUF4175 family protein [Rhizomicrobium sp.]
MSSSSQKTISPAGWPADARARGSARLRRRLGWARIVIFIERLAPALWPAIGIMGLYFALALFGLFTVTPWLVQSLILAATITAVGLALEDGFRDFRLPARQDAARRVERDNKLLHRPISEGDDMLVAGDGDPVALELWARHRARALPDRLRPAWPDPDFDARDPRRLHLILLVLLTASLIAARSEWRERLIGAFDSGAANGISLDAWVDPPPYTGIAPIYLPAGERRVIAVPAGSILNLRAHGASHAPGVSLGDLNPPRFSGTAGEYSVTAKLTHGGHVRVQASGHRIGAWNLNVIPDHAPVIAFTAPPSATERDAVKFSFKASDDYAVMSAKVVIRPHGKPGAPVVIDLPLAPAKSVAQTSYSDLTGHPYAGLTVDAHLEARDGAGQVGVSKTITFRLPQRVFTDPLARALIEQRQALATSDNRESRRAIAEMLNALTIAPEKFYADQAGVYAAIRAAYWGVRAIKSQSDIQHVEDLLWQTAMAIEQKGMLAAANNLRELQALITAAMAAHAPQEVIDQLLQRYNQAMQRYLSALAQNEQNAGKQPQPDDPNAKTLGFDDLQKLMQAIQQLSQSGNREQAAQMLAALQNMLENMRVSRQANGQGAGSQQNSELNRAIQEYGDLMGQQRALMDKTLRQQQGKGDPKDGGSQGLARQQQELRKKLDEAQQRLGSKLGKGLGKAGQQMDQAQKSLNGKDLMNARNAQENALSEMRQGADELAKEMQNGKYGQNNGQEDPLGRGQTGPGPGIKLPDANDLARARDILKELRRRAGERGRPPQELDYIDRLLREF